ncbi:TetR/AcrR family transcriptional regulator [Saxibacter everestensis]|uniref:TetR/AcrR family transcriptional regulator n=1 Tax=Saxibacter everestensis TaxID=2909229 RepID=A0ABY8QUB6_9MICO|nr:TetR/AcrR family transcriptional regulator [Brevibacteriaceae bacterium ZFBP1038]
MTSTSAREPARGRRRGFDRQQALETAMDLFWEHGYEATSVSQLCAAIGINPPSLYAAFGSKSQLFLDVVEYYERTVWQPVWDAFEGGSRIVPAVRQFLDDTVEVVSAPGAHLGCLVTLSTVSLRERDTDVARALAAIREDGARRTQARLDFGVQDGQIPAGTDTLALAHAIGMVVDGLAIRAHDGVPPDVLRRLVVSMMPTIPRTA